MSIRGHNLLKKELPSDTERMQSAPIYWRFFTKCQNLLKVIDGKKKQMSSHERPHRSEGHGKISDTMETIEIQNLGNHSFVKASLKF